MARPKVYADRHPRVTLPSGATVIVYKVTDPRFPWEVAQNGKYFYLHRLRRGDSTTWQPYVGGNGVPMHFETERDALFFIGVLDDAYQRFARESRATAEGS